MSNTFLILGSVNFCMSPEMGHSTPSLITLASGAFDRLFAPTLGHLSFCPVIGPGGGVGMGSAGTDEPRGWAFVFFFFTPRVI